MQIIEEEREEGVQQVQSGRNTLGTRVPLDKAYSSLALFFDISAFRFAIISSSAVFFPEGIACACVCPFSHLSLRACIRHRGKPISQHLPFPLSPYPFRGPGSSLSEHNSAKGES